MTRLVNIFMVFVWVFSQTLVVAHSRAHVAMDHQQHTLEASHTVSNHAPHGHATSHEPASHHAEKAMPGDEAPAGSPHSAIECCEIACQSATALHSPELAPQATASVAFDMNVKSVTCWSPGSLNPPPNPAA